MKTIAHFHATYYNTRKRDDLPSCQIGLLNVMAFDPFGLSAEDSFWYGNQISTMVENEFQTCPPNSEALTEYDEQHLVTYLRLLDADKEGADWKEVVSIIFGVDTENDSEQSEKIYHSHLARAKWVAQSGFAHLLNKHRTR